MKDEKDTIIQEILLSMNLSNEDSRKLKDLFYMKLYDYSLVKITNTDIAVVNESHSEEIYRMFFIAKRVQGCTEKTIRYYKLTLDHFFNTIQKDITQITTNDIRYFLALKKERDGNSDSNIDNIRRILSSFFNWAVEEEYMAKSPVARVKKVRVERRVKKPFKDFEIEQLRLEAADNIRLTAILEVLLSTGCRISEVSGMNKKDVEMDEIVVYGKGKKERVVYLNARARIALDRYLKTRDDDKEPLFVSELKPHARLQISAMGKEIRDLGRAAGVSDTHPHRFRRTAATMALNRGMPIDQVQIMLGHKSIETTTLYAVSAQESVKASHKKYVV